MKKTKFNLVLLSVFICTCLVIASCTKKNTTPTPAADTNTSSATDNNSAETASRDIINIGSESIDKGSLSTYKLGSGTPSAISGLSGTVTITPNTAAKTVTVTFTNFVGYDGNTRNGTILYDWSGTVNNAVFFKDSGLYVQVTTPYNNYTVGNSVSGTFTVNIAKKHIRNMGRITPGTYGNTGPCLTWSDTSSISIVKPNNGGTITWNCERNTILINTNAITYAGASIAASYTPGQFINWTTAVIGFTGNANGTTSAGTSYSANIINRVEYNFNCAPYSQLPFYHPPVAGTIDFTPTGVATRVINFGSGTCDDSYSVTIGSWSISLNFI